MAQSWDNYLDVAAALAETYPDCDVIALSTAEVVAKAKAVTGLTTEPTPVQLSLIQFAWLDALQEADADLAATG